MSKKLFWMFFLGILTFASILRLWQLQDLPIGFYSDEALYGYEAYSLLKTGKDQFGNILPLTIAGFGDYRPAAHIYATIPFIAVLGLTELAVRVPSALFGVLTILVTFFLIKSITKNVQAALLGMLMLAISPWHIYFSRMAHETNLMTLLIVSGTYLLWKYKGKTWATVIKIIFFALSLYTYHTARMFVPLFLCVTVLLFWSEVRKNIRQLLYGFILFCVLLVPLVIEFTNPENLSRIQGVSFWNDPGIVSYINEQRRVAEIEGKNPVVTKLIYNKAVIYPQVFIKNFASHFSLDFLIFKGDPNGIYNTPNTGILLWVELAFIPLGLWSLWKTQRKIFWWMLMAIGLALIPDSLTRVAPSSARIHIALPFLALLNGVGIYSFLKLASFSWARNQFRVPAFTVSAVVGINSVLFWSSYVDRVPVQNARAWQIGTKEMILRTQELSPDFEKIWISREGWGWIHLVFHTKYNPEILQTEITPSAKNELGFWWVTDIGKYHLENFPKDFAFNEPDTLYVGIPQEFPANTQVHERIKHPLTQEELFWFVSNQ